jgi:hypothetical protein
VEIIILENILMLSPGKKKRIGGDLPGGKQKSGFK